MRSIVKAKAVAVSKAAVHLDPANKVLRTEIPALNGSGENQLQFDFVVVFLAGFGIRGEEARLHVVTFAFFQDFVRAILVFVFHVENRIDEVLAFQRPETVLPAESREQGAVAERGLSVEIKLGRPPGGGTVFKFCPEGVEAVAAALRAKRGEVLDSQVSGLFKVVVVSDEVRILLGVGRGLVENNQGRKS